MPTSLTPPLTPFTVLELSRTYAAGLAGHYLRGYGATVIRPDLDVDLDADTGGIGPGLTADESAYVHAGKHTADDWRRLLATADVVLSDLQPKHLATLGIDWHRHADAHPEQIVVSVTAFGLRGPYADFEHTNATAFALGGIMGLTGDPDRAPLLTGGNQAYALAGLNAFAATSCALAGRQRHGRGEFVEISGQECASSMLEYYGPYTSFYETPMPRLGNHTRATWGVYPCADGWCGVFALARQVPALFALMNDSELAEERFTDPVQRTLPENEDELTAKIYVFLADKTMAELRELSVRTKVPFGICRTPNDLLDDAALAERGALERHGETTVPSRPFPGLSWVAAHTPNETSPEPHGEGAGAKAEPNLPLAGLRVLDLTMMWAGPYATLRLGEMGADVIKIESPSAWDNIRTLLPQPDRADPWNSSVYFNAYNREKRSLTLDLAQPAGVELLLRLVETADVVIENYRADVLDKLGIGVDVLHTRNPKLTVISMAAFGKHGPDSSYVGFGPVIELMSGLASLSGYGDGEVFKTGISYGDPVAGTAAVAATALALLAGGGVHIDLAQLEVAMTLIGEEFLAASRGEVPVHRANSDRRFDQDAYRCAGDDRWLVVSVRNDADRSALDRVLNGSALADWCAGLDAQVAMEALQAAGVPAGAVGTTTTLLDDPNHVAQGFWIDVPHPRMHTYRQQNAVWHLHSCPSPLRRAPLFGEHNNDILAEELGLSESELDELRRTLVIADAPINPGVG